MKKDQGGFTLVELLIAVAIMSIVLAVVCGFIVVGSKTYASANNDITVQQEAQLALNQMSDVLIDTTRSINYVGYDAGGTPSSALKDAEFTFEPEGKSLIMYNGEATVKADGTEEIEEGNGNRNYQFYWDKEDETLYYIDIPYTDKTFPSVGAAGWEVLAEHVTAFSVDLTQVEEKRAVSLELTFEMGNKEYKTANNITVRNRVLINDVEIEPLDKSVTLSVIPKKSSVILEPGETYHFSTPKVTGKNILDKSVTWTIDGGAGATDSYFTDAANGIIQIGNNEKVTSFNVIITTNAVDSDGNPATATVIVYVKRANNVSLSKTKDSNSKNGAASVSAGCEFTISAEATGVKLGVSCDGCSDDVSKDKEVVDSNTTNGWQVFVGEDIVSLTSCDSTSATFKVSTTAKKDAVIKIYATSWLSAQKGYKGGAEQNDYVTGVIELTVQQTSKLKTLGSPLRYGVETLCMDLAEGMTTDHNRWVECIRVVDESHQTADRILVHYTIGNGNNIRIAPDLFDLDLNGTYTFYIQMLDPVSIETRKKVKEDKGQPIEDDKETIKKEYKEHITDNAEDGYTGSKYTVSDVYVQRLEGPIVTFTYKGENYQNTEIRDTIKFTELDQAILGEVKPSNYENIYEPGDNGHNAAMRYTVYKGEGDDPSGWEKLFDVDGDILEQQTSKTALDGALRVDPYGSMFLKIEKKLTSLCGTYHVIPGIVYQNLDKQHYEIIYDNFDFDNLPREKRYYELTNSAFHITVTQGTTMTVDCEKYKGEVDFPLPSDSVYSSYFPNSKNTEWQVRTTDLTLSAIKDGSNERSTVTFNKVKYRYIASENAYEVMPIFTEYGSVYEYCAGTYKCKYGDTRWTQLEKASRISKLNMDIETAVYTGKVYFYLPSESEFTNIFGSVKNTEWQETTKSMWVKGIAKNSQDVKDVEIQKVRYRYNAEKKAYEVEPIITVDSDMYYAEYSCGIYRCSDGGAQWTQVSAASPKITSKANMTITIDGEECVTHFYTPSETNWDQFWFKTGQEGDQTITWHRTFTYYKKTDTTGSSPSTHNFSKVTCNYTNGVYTVEFWDKTYVGWDNTTYKSIYRWDSYGTYQCTDTGDTWTKVKEAYSYETQE
jgi:prepilin-type N-terminal cleavage/methylation domain-containing protein